MVRVLRLSCLPVVLSWMMQIPVERRNSRYFCRVSLAVVCKRLRQVDLHLLATASRNTGAILNIPKNLVVLVM